MTNLIKGAKLDLRNKKNLPQIIAWITKQAADHNLDDIQEGLSKFGWGKAAAYLVQKAIEKPDADTALHDLLLKSYTVCFLKGCTLVPKLHHFTKELFDTWELPKPKGGKEEFDINNIEEHPFAQALEARFQELLDIKKADAEESNRVMSYVRRHLRIRFFEIWEDNKTVYHKLEKYANSESQKAYLADHQRSRYEEALWKNYDEPIMQDESGATLHQTYVCPSFDIWEKSIKPDHPFLEKKDDSSFVPTDQNDLHEFLYQTLRGDDKQKLFEREVPRFFILLGHPGQGKTSFLTRLLYDFAKHQTTISQDDKPFYFLKLRYLDKPETLLTGDLLKSLQGELTSYARNHAQTIKEPSIEQLEKSLIVLDGLDELFITKDFDRGKIDEFCRELARLVKNKPQLQIVLTSRL
ncbi:MAG: NACHT domain-containing protein, partial [Bacteroidota bacterium]